MIKGKVGATKYTQAGKPYNWPKFTDYSLLDLTSQDKKTRLVGARFSLVIVLNESAVKLKKVIVIESADQYYWTGENYVKFDSASYRNQKNIDDEPVDLTAGNRLLRKFSNVTIGPTGPKNERTLFIMDSPFMSFTDGAIPLRMVSARVELEDADGNLLAYDYSFSLKLDPANPNGPPIFNLKTPKGP
jgi:hypothetical protein